MPRKPTGNPRGRPKGTGRLGEQTRLTVRIPQTLYTRLEAFAEGRSYTRGTPQLAVCVREALEHYLSGTYKRQTENTSELRNSALRALENKKRQTIIAPEVRMHPEEIQCTIISQSINE